MCSEPFEDTQAASAIKDLYLKVHLPLPDIQECLGENGKPSTSKCSTHVSTSFVELFFVHKNKVIGKVNKITSSDSKQTLID